MPFVLHERPCASIDTILRKYSIYGTSTARFRVQPIAIYLTCSMASMVLSFISLSCIDDLELWLALMFIRVHLAAGSQCANYIT